MMDPLLQRIDNARRDAEAAGQAPRFLAVGTAVAHRLRQIEGVRQGNVYLPGTITLSGRILGMHVYEDPDLKSDQFEVRERMPAATEY